MTCRRFEAGSWPKGWVRLLALIFAILIPGRTHAAGTVADIGESQALVHINQDASNDLRLLWASVGFATWENVPAASMVVLREPAADLPPVQANYETIAGTALPGVDYLPVSGIVELGRDETRQTIGVPLVNDGLPEEEKFFQFRLFVPLETGGIRVLSELRVYIRDNDSGFGLGQYPGPSDIVAESSEGASSVSVVVRRGGDGPGTVTVDYVTENGTATAEADYTAVSGTLVFGPRQSLTTIIVPLFNDLLPEGDETFGIRLFNPSTNAAIGTNAVGKIIIHDNDVGFVLEAATNLVREDTREFSVTVFKGVEPPRAAVVTYQVDGLTATSGKDFVAVSGTLEFGPDEVRKTITVPILDDFLLEGPESFVVRLTASSGVVLGEPHVLPVGIVDVEPVPGFDPGFHGGISGQVHRLVTLPDGRIVVGGDYYLVQGKARRDICRLGPDGTLDSTFRAENGNTLERVTDIRPPWGTLGVDAENRSLIAGWYVSLEGEHVPGLFWLRADGSLDRAFAPSFAGFSHLAAFWPGGGVVFAGGFAGGHSIGLPAMVAKLRADGGFDPSFARPSLAWQKTGGGLDQNARLFVDSSGRIVITHASFAGSEGVRWPVVRLLPDGVPDPTFTPPAGNPRLGPVLLRQDGRLVVATATNACPDAGDPSLCGRLFQLTIGGVLDPTFRPPTIRPPIVALAEHADRRLLVGYQNAGSVEAPVVERLHPDGRVDPGFGPVWYSPGAFGRIRCVAALPDGGAVLGGATSVNGVETEELFRVPGTPPSGIADVRRLPDGTIRISVACAPGADYVLESSVGLKDWAAQATRTAVEPGVVFEVPASGAAAFFRVRSR